MTRRLLKYMLVCALCAAMSCMESGLKNEKTFDFAESERGLFIINEGGFQYGNASLSYYDIATRRLENEVFVKANAEKLGDTAQSMSIYGERGYVVVNNSGEVYAINLDTFRVTGKIEGLQSPRYIHFVSPEKAYVTDLYAAAITVFDPRTMRITGRIETPGHRSTEQMVQWEHYVFVNCWSHDHTILIIDTRTDSVDGQIEVGLQPTSLAIDSNGKIWTITDGGGYEGNPAGYETPYLYRIDPASRRIEQAFAFELGDAPSEICTDGRGESIYFINRSIWKMAADAERLPEKPLIPYNGSIYYGLGIDPETSEIYVADAIDYSQSGIVYRYSASARAVDTLRVGITPSAFCFKIKSKTTNEIR